MGGRGGSSGMSSGGSIQGKIDSMPSTGFSSEKVNLLPMASENIIREASALFNRARKEGNVKYVDMEVNVKDLKTRQDWVDGEKLKSIAESTPGRVSGLATDYDGGIRALKYKGNLIVVDGNHRANLAILKRQKRIKIRVLEVSR